MMYRRGNIERKIIDLQRMLATTSDPLETALLKLAIESFESEMASLQTAEASIEGGETGINARLEAPPLRQGLR
jgi:hypothetical protein